MRRRRVAAASAMLAVVALVSSCSVPAEWAARLNADGSVDYLSCWDDLEEIEVDYAAPGETADTIEWRAHRSGMSDSGMLLTMPVDVAYYGQVPPDWTIDVPEHRPPSDWIRVSTSAGFAMRDDLREGEWIWFTNGYDWPWIPFGHRTCRGWELGPDAEPRRIP
ncbi:MAG: hypothetical protein KF727_04320 [Microbacteriaceae bacterium]|nr:hypothetical protein [Microbacteriaceae bacterium]